MLDLVRYHHGSNGTSYVPDVNVQILSLADKYSALTEKRVYKEAFSPQKALTIIYGDVKKVMFIRLSSMHWFRRFRQAKFLKM